MCLFALVASRVWKIVGSRRSFGNRRRRSDPRATIVRMPWLCRGSSATLSDSPPPRNLLSVVSVRATLKPRKEVNVHKRYGRHITLNIAYHLGERGAHADARGRGVSCSKPSNGIQCVEFARARIAAHRRTERRSRRGGCGAGGGRRPRAVFAASRPPGLMAPASRRHTWHTLTALFND